MASDQIGEYRIVQEIGQGGMATVYKAYQPSFDRYVAIKALPPQLSDDPKFFKRFQHEARMIARLEHRSILPVYAYGEQDGMPYIVMRLLEAGTLARRLFQGPLDLPTAARIVEQVAEALDYAHAQGVIHRDLKPSNILLDEQHNAYLTDFGIAKILGSTSHLTGYGVVGTPSYMSPEQCQGQSAIPASDIYALGVILFELVTGHQPFEADTPLAVMYLHVREPVPSVREFDPSLPASLDRVIGRAMAKRPEDRYRSGHALAAALWKAVEGAEHEAVVAPPSQPRTPGKAEARPRRARRGRAAILNVLVGATVLLGIAGAVLLIISWIQQDDQGNVGVPTLPAQVDAPGSQGNDGPVIAPETATPSPVADPASPTPVTPTTAPSETPTGEAGIILEPSPAPTHTPPTGEPTPTDTAWRPAGRRWAAVGWGTAGDG